MESAEGGPGIWHALDKDTLEEVAAHCSVGALLSLQQTCTSFWQLLSTSEKVWVRKLAEDFGMHLKALPPNDVVFARLARTVYEASPSKQLRFQGALVTGGVDMDSMQYWVDNMFKPDKSSYCSNCSYNADCLALLLDGKVPRDAEYERVRQYIVRRCRYAAALIMNVQLPNQDRDPDAVMDILEDWTDDQLENFFRDLVAAMNQQHPLGRLLVYDVEHGRVPLEQQRISAVERYLRERLDVMKKAMLKPAGRPNTLFDSSMMEKLRDPGQRSLAGIVSEVTLSRQGRLTCPASCGVVLLGHMDYAQLDGLSPEQVLQELEAATQDPACAAFNHLRTSEQVEAACAAGSLPPIAVTDQTLAGIWHEFDTSAAEQAEQDAVPQGTAGLPPGSGPVPMSTSPAPQARPQLAGGPAGQPAAAARSTAAAVGRDAAPAAAGPSSAAPLSRHGIHPSVGFAGPGTSAAAAAGAGPASSAILRQHPQHDPTANPGVGLRGVQPAADADGDAARQAGAAAAPDSQPEGPPDSPPPHRLGHHLSLRPPFKTGAATETPLAGRLVKWRPAVWFHFHRYGECVQFVRSNHGLLTATAPQYGKARVRHRGPPPPADIQQTTLHLPSYLAQQAQHGQQGGSGPSNRQLPAHHQHQQQHAVAGVELPGGSTAANPFLAAYHAALAQQQQQQYAEQHQPGFRPFPPAPGAPAFPPPAAPGAPAFPPAVAPAGPAAGPGHLFFQPAGLGLGGPGPAAAAPAFLPAMQAVAGLAGGPAQAIQLGGAYYEGSDGGYSESDWDSEEEGDVSSMSGAEGAAGPAGLGASGHGHGHAHANGHAGHALQQGADQGGGQGPFGAQQGGMDLNEDPFGEAAGGLPPVDLPPAGGAGAPPHDDEDAASDGGSDDEEQHAQHVSAFYQAVAAAALEAEMARLAAPGHSGAHQGAGAQDSLAARPSLGLVSRRSTRGRNMLQIQLSKPAAANVVLVKLIDQENMMQLYRDNHDWPNIDMGYVGLSGRAVALPQGVAMRV
ncbi:hypothetical protein N2152v2_009846 [Parachlorella kessleri]